MPEFKSRPGTQPDPIVAPKLSVDPAASAPQHSAVPMAGGAVDPAVLKARSDLFKGQYGDAPAHPLLARAGEGLGLALGVGVTEGLALLPKWNQPVVDAGGKPVASVPGAERIGNHNILKRHQEVVGPQLAALDQKIAPGALHDFVGGLATGASEAPGTSYRLEAHLADALGGKPTH